MDAHRNPESDANSILLASEIDRLFQPRQPDSTIPKPLPRAKREQEVGKYLLRNPDQYPVPHLIKVVHEITGSTRKRFPGRPRDSPLFPPFVEVGYTAYS